MARARRRGEGKKIYAGLCRLMQARFGSSGRPTPTERHKYRGGRADVGIGPYETMKRNAAHKTADADRHDR